jgi:hypothetical protein
LDYTIGATMTNEELIEENTKLKQQISVLIFNLRYVLRQPEKYRSDMEKLCSEIESVSD